MAHLLLHWGINMTTAFFSPALNAFIPAAWKNDGTYNDETWPVDAIEATDAEVSVYWRQTPPNGKQLGVVDGRPAWVDIPPLSSEQEKALADQQKVLLLNAATAKIVIWQTKLLMGRKLTDNETVQLNNWIDYIDSVTAIDTATAPDISWPALPE